jgi:hypothetical protein
MDDRVHALEVGGLHLTHVLLDRVDGFAPGAEGRPPVQVGVETTTSWPAAARCGAMTVPM